MALSHIGHGRTYGQPHLQAQITDAASSTTKAPLSPELAAKAQPVHVPEDTGPPRHRRRCSGRKAWVADPNCHGRHSCHSCHRSSCACPSTSCAAPPSTVHRPPPWTDASNLPPGQRPSRSCFIATRFACSARAGRDLLPCIFRPRPACVTDSDSRARSALRGARGRRHTQGTLVHSALLPTPRRSNRPEMRYQTPLLEGSCALLLALLAT